MLLQAIGEEIDKQNARASTMNASTGKSDGAFGPGSLESVNQGDLLVDDE